MRHSTIVSHIAAAIRYGVLWLLTLLAAVLDTLIASIIGALAGYATQFLFLGDVIQDGLFAVGLPHGDVAALGALLGFVSGCLRVGSVAERKSGA